MDSPARIRISPDGTLRLPNQVMGELSLKTGSYLEVTVKDGCVRLRPIEVDPFAEAMKKPEAAMFDKILEGQKKSQEDAFKAFDERLKKKDFPEVRPEDKPDYWR